MAGLTLFISKGPLKGPVVQGLRSRFLEPNLPLGKWGEGIGGRGAGGEGT